MGYAMNIEHLREFVYLAETLSFSITARHFFISQSVLSKHIASLESSLGVQLFDRDRRHVELTANGRLFYEDCNVILNDYDHAITRITMANMDRTLTIRVGYLRNASRPFIVTFIDFMKKHHPEVHLVMKCMEYGELIHAHQSHELDIIFSLDLDPEADEICDFDYVYSDKLYAVMRKRHPLASHTQGIKCSDLEQASILLPRKRDYPGLSEFIERFIPPSCSSVQHNHYSDIDTLYMELASDDLIAFSSGHNIAVAPADMVFLPLLDADTSYTVSARWLKPLDHRIVEAASGAIAQCRATMQNWGDGWKGADES